MPPLGRCFLATLLFAGPRPVVSEASAFLGDDLPLSVLSVLPAAPRPSPEAPELPDTRIGGRTALTIIFSRPVIALGADWQGQGNNGSLPKSLIPFHLEACKGHAPFKVPGRMRWSSTSIARFDPEIDWPTDLCFQLKPNLELRSYDGLSLNSSAAVQSYSTRPVGMHVSFVRSERASSLTDGKWTSNVPDSDGHETPPDAVIYLSFSATLDHAMVFKALREANWILQSSSSDLWDDCGPRCLAVRPRGLKAGQTYDLVFPKGGRYAEYAGEAGSALSVTLLGLVRFTFPFWFKTPPTDSWQNHKLRYRRQKLYLRHGLEATNTPDAQLAALQAAMTLSDAQGSVHHFDLHRTDNATLLLECATLEPDQRYRLQVDGSVAVRDGYGQALEACSMEYDTADRPDAFLQAEVQESVFFRRSPGDWTVLSRGDGNHWCDRRTPLLPIPIPWPLPCLQRPYELKAWPVSQSNFVKALAQRWNLKQTFLDPAAAVKVVAPQSNELQAVVLEEGKLLHGNGGGGLFLREERRYSESLFMRGFVSVASFGVSFVATATEELLVWVTDFESGNALEEATVTVYCIPPTLSEDVQPGNVTLLAKGTTGANGTVTLAVPRQSGFSKLAALVEAKSGALAYSEGLPVPWVGPADRTVAELLTDRLVYRPGDTVHLKGYLRNRSADLTRYSLPDADEAFEFQVQWKSGGVDRTTHVPTSLVTRYGTVSADLAIPESEDEVSYGDVAIRLVRVPDTTVVSATITIADPRPPTVTLDLSTKAKVVYPGSAASVDIDVHTATYSGTGVEGAKVELKWRLERRSGGTEPGSDGMIGLVGLPLAGVPTAAPRRWRPPSSGKRMADASGQVTVITGRGGNGSTTLALAALLEEAGEDGGAAAPCKEGDLLFVSAHWVGPTREVVKAELGEGPLRTSRSPYMLALKPTQKVDAHEGLPLPGSPFAVYVDVHDADGESVDVPVSLSLHEWDGSSPVGEEDPMALVAASDRPSDIKELAKRSGLFPPEKWGSQVGEVCKARADGAKEAQCAASLTIPEAKKYVVLARATAPGSSEQLVTAFAVGKTPSEWEERPLVSMDAAVDVRLDKKSYAVGDVAELSLVSPFQDATALVLWGNGAGRQTKQQKLQGVPGRSHSITLSLGDECSFGCYAMVLVVAPDQPKSAVLPVAVPASPLLDVTLPRRASAQVRLEVPDAHRAFEEGAVKVSVVTTGASGDVVAEVLPPGEKAQVKVTMPTSEAGAEVCIFVVDKAMLDVGSPHRVAELDKDFALSRGERFRCRDTRDGLASAEGYRATVATALRRAAMDPWAGDTSWPLKHRSFSSSSFESVEKSDEDYFAGLTSDATYFPPGARWFSHAVPPGVQLVPTGEAMLRSSPMGMEDAEVVPVAAEAPAPSAASTANDAVADVEADAMMVRAPAPATTSAAPGVGGKRKGGGSLSLGKAARVRSHFETTPLFKASAVVGEDGVAAVPFKLPDNIGTFDVRAYVVDGAGAHKFGHASTSIIARRDVSLEPSVPRVVRPGDRFECGVTVTGHVPQQGGGVDLPEGGVALLAKIAKNSSSLTLREDDLAAWKVSRAKDGSLQRSLSPGAGGSPQEIVFPFEAMRGSALGEVALQFDALESSGLAIDALTARVNVKASQAPVLVATSSSIQAPSHAGEGMELPEAVPGSGELVLTAGVGHLPAVVSNAASLTKRRMNSGQTLVAALVPAAALSLYYPAGEPCSAEARAAAGLEKVAATFTEALGKLRSYTSTSLGLRWHLDEQWPHADIYLNTFAMIVAQLVSEFKEMAPPSEGSSGKPRSAGAWSSLSLTVPATLQAEWRAAVVRVLFEQVNTLRYDGHPPCTSNCFKSWHQLAQVRAALGFRMRLGYPSLQEELSMDRLFSAEALDALCPLGLSYAALAYTLHGHANALPGEAADGLAEVYRRLASHLRVQGRTVYIAASPESQHSAGLEANAAVLLALAHAGEGALAKHFADNSGSSLAAKLATYVADGAGTGRSARLGGGDFMGARDAAMACAALAAFDLVHNSTRPDLRLRAASGALTVLEAVFEGSGSPPTRAAVPWEKLAQPPKPLRFQALGRGQVSVLAALSFVPATLPTQGAVYRGLFLEKVVRRMDPVTGEPAGPALQLVRLGDSVVVTIQVTTPDDLERVTLEDFAAGGLEPVDPNVAGDSAGSSSSHAKGCWGQAWWCAPSFAYRETFADRVTWSSWGSLPAGTHTVSYQAVAATRGVFALPPAHAFAEDQPELMGLSQASSLVVLGKGFMGLPEEPVEEEDDDAILQRLGVQPRGSVAPKACPGGCPHGGVCQLATGKCGCYDGLRFADGDCTPQATKAVVPSSQHGVVELAAVPSASSWRPLAVPAAASLLPLPLLALLLLLAAVAVLRHRHAACRGVADAAYSRCDLEA